jgi:hypothetical protein
MNTDTLMAGILEQYDTAEPGTRAAVDQEAAAIRDELTGKGIALTTDVLREYFAQVIAFGLAENVGDEESWRADFLGMRLAGVCLLRRDLGLI